MFFRDFIKAAKMSLEKNETHLMDFVSLGYETGKVQEPTYKFPTVLCGGNKV